MLVPLPPTIVTEPDVDIIFDPRTNLELPCLAQGNPTPSYSWTKNGRFYAINAQDNRVTIASDSGTLVFTQPQMLDQGWYQCNATNIWGKEKLKYFILLLIFFFRRFRYCNISKSSCTYG